MIKRFFLSIFLCSFFVFAAFALDDNIPERPSPPRLVNNLSKEIPGFLSPEEEQRLEKKLSDFANQTSNQIVIAIVDDLEGMEAWDFATKLGHKWGVGQAKFDNGVVILIKPTGGEGQRDIHIAVGYGLEGAIPDLTAKQIRENEIYPYFKQNDFYTGLDKATDVLMALTKGEYSSDAYGQKYSTQKLPLNIIIPVVIIIFLMFIRSRKRGKGKGGLSMGRGFIPFGGFGGGGFGGGGFGGGSSGGFGGFGGGGFGGGGSGGKW